MRDSQLSEGPGWGHRRLSRGKPEEVILAKFKVKVRWMAEAIVTVDAPDENLAYDAVWERGLPWDLAQEADDGSNTSFEIMDEEGPDG